MVEGVVVDAYQGRQLESRAGEGPPTAPSGLDLKLREAQGVADPRELAPGEGYAQQLADQAEPGIEWLRQDAVELGFERGPATRAVN